jgi:PKD repeat protein
MHIYTISSMYTAAAAYTVSLTVTNGVGMDTETKPNFIVVSP